MIEILIVEDDADIREILEFNLESAGYSILSAVSAEEGMRKLTPRTALILLDVMLPGMSGFQMARRLREDGCDIPVIFLTARTAENDILTGFSAGADDYLQKPFSINEVLARVKAVLRRTHGDSSSNVLSFGPLEIDLDASAVRRSGIPIELTKKEFELLSLLASRPDSYFNRATIIAQLWKDAPYVVDRTIDVHMARIRTKLGPCRDIIKNKTGFGYYLDSSYEVQE